MTTYTLVLTEHQLRLVRDAVELAARLTHAQISEVRRWLPKEQREAWHEQIWEMQKHPVYTGRRSEDGDACWDMYQHIRYRLAWDQAGNPPQRRWPEMMSVCYDEPIMTGTQPPITVTRSPNS